MTHHHYHHYHSASSSSTTSSSSTSASSSTSSYYFTEGSVLANTPPALLYLAAIYLVLLSIGILMTREKPSVAEKKNPPLKERVRAALGYLVSDVLGRKDFWLLWASRYCLLICGAGIISHWKTFSFTQNKNDQESRKREI